MGYRKYDRRSSNRAVAQDDVCPQCERVNVRTVNEVRKNYVCMSCTRINES